MKMSVRFACGHATTMWAANPSEPICPECGETRVTRIGAPPPRFRGACAGPYAVTEAVDAVPVNLAPGGAFPTPKDDRR